MSPSPNITKYSDRLNESPCALSGPKQNQKRRMDNGYIPPQLQNTLGQKEDMNKKLESGQTACICASRPLASPVSGMGGKKSNSRCPWKKAIPSSDQTVSMLDDQGQPIHPRSA